MRVVLALASVLALGACAAQAPAAGGLLIRDVMIASPEREAPYGPVSVRIRDGRIAELGERLRPGPGAAVIDGAGRYLSPGLIDSHVHLGEVPGLPIGAADAHPELAAAWRAQAPRSFLFHGFTTLIDLMASAEGAAAWNANNVAPEALFCGGAPVMDGYPSNFFPAPQRYQLLPDFVIDPARADALPEGVDAAHHTAEAAVARIADAGAVCVKTAYERGFGRVRNLPTPSPQLLRAMQAAAQARGLPLLLHANSLEAHQVGLAGGVDLFVHGIWNGRGDEAELFAQIDAEIAAGIPVQSTIQVLYGEGDLLDPDFLARPGLADVYPRALLDWYATDAGQWFRNDLLEAPGVAELVAAGRWQEALAAPVARVTSALRYGAANGQRLLFGSDTPSGPTYANPPGLNGRWEMDRWIAAGVAPRDVFRAATIANAEFFGLDHLGAVAVGKEADLLLLGADPFASVEAFDAIDIVILDGEPIARADLSARR